MSPPRSLNSVCNCMVLAVFLKEWVDRVQRLHRVSRSSSSAQALDLVARTLQKPCETTVRSSKRTKQKHNGFTYFYFQITSKLASGLPRHASPSQQSQVRSDSTSMSPRGPQLTLGRNAKRIVTIIPSPPNAMYWIVYLIWQPIISVQIRSLIFFVFMVTYPNGTYRITTITNIC